MSAKPDSGGDALRLHPELALRRDLVGTKLACLSKMIEYFEDDLHVYRVSAAMNSGNLQEFMERKFIRYLEESTLLATLPLLFDVVAKIHGAGYLHTQIRPSSILLHRDSSVKGIQFVLDGLS